MQEIAAISDMWIAEECPILPEERRVETRIGEVRKQVISVAKAHLPVLWAVAQMHPHPTDLVVQRMVV